MNTQQKTNTQAPVLVAKLTEHIVGSTPNRFIIKTLNLVLVAFLLGAQSLKRTSNIVVAFCDCDLHFTVQWLSFFTCVFCSMEFLFHLALFESVIWTAFSFWQAPWCCTQWEEVVFSVWIPAPRLKEVHGQLSSYWSRNITYQGKT